MATSAYPLWRPALRPRRLGVLLLLACCVAGSFGANPVIWQLSFDDEDNMDRTFGEDDELKLLFVSEDSGTFSPGAGFSTGFILNNAVGTTMFRPDILGMLSFTADLGSDFRGTWTSLVPGLIDQLTIKIHNASGADDAALNARAFNVSCVTSQVTLVAGGTSCPDTPKEPTLSLSDWGEGRPVIANVSSGTASPTLLLAAGDTVTVAFEHPVDVAQIDDEIYDSIYVKAKGHPLHVTALAVWLKERMPPSTEWVSPRRHTVAHLAFTLTSPRAPPAVLSRTSRRASLSSRSSLMRDR